MKVIIIGQIEIRLNTDDVNQAVAAHPDWSSREAIIEEARQEAYEYIHDAGYLEIRRHRIDAEAVILFDIKDTGTLLDKTGYQPGRGNPLNPKTED